MLTPPESTGGAGKREQGFLEVWPRKVSCLPGEEPDAASARQGHLKGRWLPALCMSPAMVWGSAAPPGDTAVTQRDFLNSSLPSAAPTVENI